MSIARRCPHCDSELSGTLPDGLCPACLLIAALTPASAATPSRAAQSLPHIDGYRLIEEIGVGGMGVVYKAEQQRPITRLVAIKLIKLGMDTQELIARFDGERQALAQLNHPNVAAVYHADATHNGRPFFVMEYVPGEAITAFCDRHRYTTRQRLELFTQACDGIQHAHQKAIIHRDIKPSNLLVMLADGKPLVKVIDFGVAKATAPRLTEQTMFTAHGQLMGTPEYMSPEQAQSNASDVDTRSDVYSLGVVLYELLTGAVPFDSKALREAAYAQIQRIIREVDPPRPSTRLSSLGDGAIEVAKHRQMELAALEKQLRGELEWIPLKALRKDRTYRYSTANELADDVRNYLENKPLSAGPVSAAYRAKKFLRRNKGPVFAAAAILIVLVAGVIVSTMQAIRIKAEQKNTLAQKNEADRQRQAAAASERDAQRNLAESHAATGDALLGSRDVLRARAAYIDAIRVSEKLGVPAPVALTGLAQSYVESPAALMRLHSHSRTSCVAFAPDGRSVATGDDAVRIWDVVTGVKTAELRAQKADRIRALAYSPDGTTLLAAGNGQTVRLWDVQRKDERHSLRGHTDTILGVAWHPDGRRAVSASSDGKLLIWDTETGTLARAIQPALGEMWAVAVSRDGSMVASGGISGVLRIWDFDTGALRQTIRPERGQINDIAFSPDCTKVLMTHWDKSMDLWDVRSGMEVKRYGPVAGVMSHIALNGDGTRCISTGGDGNVRIWDVSEAVEKKRFAATTGWIYGVGASPDFSVAVTGDCSVWDLAEQTDVSSFAAHDTAMTGIDVSADGRLLITSDGRGIIKLWDVATWTPLRVLVGHSGASEVRFFNNDRQALSVGKDASIIWDLQKGQKIRKLSFAGLGFASVASDRRTAVVSTSRQSSLVDLESGAIITSFPLPQDERATGEDANGYVAIAADISPDGSTVATGHPGNPGGNFAVLWDAATGKQIHVLRGHGHWVSAVAFAPDKKVILTGSWDQRLILWDAATGKALRTFRGHTSFVNRVAFSPDGVYALSTAGDATLRLWDVSSAKQIRSFSVNQQRAVNGATFLNQETVLACGWDGRLHVWRLDWYRQLQEQRKRLQDAQERLTREPDNGEALRDIGQWYVFRGKFDWAAQLFEKAQARGTPVSPLTLARCYWKLGHLKQAEEQFARAAAASEAPESYVGLFRERVAPTRRPTTTQLLVDNLQDAPSYEAMTRANSIAYRLRVDKQFEEAAALREAVVNAARKRWPAGFPTIARFQLDYADLLIFMERYADASRLAREIVTTTALPSQRSRATSMLDAMSSKTATRPEVPSTQPSAELAVMDSSSWTEQMLYDASQEAAKLRDENKLADAEIVQRAIVSRTRELGLLSTRHAAAYLGHYAALLLRMEKFEEAQSQFDDIYDLRMSEGDHASARKVLVELNRMYTLWKRPELAAECDKLAASASLPKTLRLNRRPSQPLAAPASAPVRPL